MNYERSYLVKIQYLGFRWHGWQKQPNVKTVHFALDKTIRFVLDGVRFKAIGVGRTDAKVSSLGYFFQLFVDETLNGEMFLEAFNRNSPADLYAISILEIEDNSFNIIKHSKSKEYHYYFSNEGKNHPYAAPFMTGYNGLNIELMQEGAKLFEGTHFFGCYCAKPSEATELVRTVDYCSIQENTFLQASFFPNESYALRVKGRGFLRYQIRLMMGVLSELGKGNLSLDDIKNSLIESEQSKSLAVIAPGSGLHLYDVSFI